MPARRSVWSRPLRIHLSVVIVLLLVAIALPLIWLSYTQGVRLSATAATQQMRLLGGRAAERYQTVLGDGLSAASTLSASQAFRSHPPADLDAKTRLLMKALEASSFIDTIFAGYPDGSFIQMVAAAANARWAEAMEMPEGTVFALRVMDPVAGRGPGAWQFLDAGGATIAERQTPPTSYDPRRRPWYNEAAGGDRPVAVGPYVMATTRSLGFTIAAPMESEDGVVIGADVLLETLSRLLSREAVSPNAEGYVFDERGRLIIHSDPTHMERLIELLASAGRSDIDTLDDPILASVERLALGRGGSGSGTATFEIDGEPYLAQMTRFEMSGLTKGKTVVIAAPLSDFTADSEQLLRHSLLLSAVLLTGGILAALMVSRLISRSLAGLADDARHMGDLDLERPGVKASYITEINALGRALDTARDAILSFAVFVPRELVRRIVASGQDVVGSADRLEVTILFTDIRDFTTISENSAPEDVVRMLSEYFGVMNEVVEQHRGVILQYLGDSINAIWNAPSPDPSHAEDACRCALALKAAIEAFNARNLAEGRPEFVTRFGLHTGEAVVGTVGARSRLQYTAMGDTVNVASRLEGINKEFGTSILVSRAVVDRAGPGLGFRALGHARAKGRHESIEIFELTGVADAIAAGATDPMAVNPAS